MLTDCINSETKLIGRFHTQKNGTGLNIYNPYFQALGINAAYILFTSETSEPLIDGMRKLNLCGAITAGFEHDSTLPELVDELTDAAKFSSRVGVISNNDGVLQGHYQGGEGLLNALLEKFDITDKKVVLVGAGTVAKTLLLAIDQSTKKPRSIAVVNRTIEKAILLTEKFDFVVSAHSLNELPGLAGDILINTSRIGSKAHDDIFTSKTIKQYSAAADVTFGDPNTNLVMLAKENGLIKIDGWDMFTHQAAVVLKICLDHNADIERLREFVKIGLGQNNHGAKLERNRYGD